MGHCVLNEAEAPPAERQDVAELIACGTPERGIVWGCDLSGIAGSCNCWKPRIGRETLPTGACIMSVRREDRASGRCWPGKALPVGEDSPATLFVSNGHG